MGESMVVVEVNGDLFKPEDWYDGEVTDLYFAHCIASDFGMFGGIARQFVEKLNMKNRLIDYSYRYYINDIVLENSVFGVIKVIPKLVGKSVLVGNTFNLITKLYTHDKPEPVDFESSIQHMKRTLVKNEIKALAIPDMIGCGIDGLDRDWVLEVLKKALNELDINLYIVKLPDDRY